MLWINPLVGQMVLSPTEPEGLAVNINMGAHPQAFPNHVSSLSQFLPVPDLPKLGNMRCQVSPSLALFLSLLNLLVFCFQIIYLEDRNSSLI